MSDEKKTPLEDLLKSLEGHVVESVEIRGEHVIVCEGNEGDILHVRISATELDPKHSEHVRLASKVLSFSILEADFLSRILGYFVDRFQANLQSSSEILANLKEREISITKDLTFSLKDVRKLLDFIKGTITETLRIRKPKEAESEVCKCGHSKADHEFIEGLDADHHCNISECLCTDYEEAEG